MIGAYLYLYYYYMDCLLVLFQYWCYNTIALKPNQICFVIRYYKY